LPNAAGESLRSYPLFSILLVPREGCFGRAHSFDCAQDRLNQVAAAFVSLLASSFGFPLSFDIRASSFGRVPKFFCHASLNFPKMGDFNRDIHPDYAAGNPVTDRTAIWYLLGPTFIGGAYGPTLPSGWELVATADFNGGGKPDYVLYNANTRQTAIWYMNNTVFVSSA
jgi:hypothetical protein